MGVYTGMVVLGTIVNFQGPLPYNLHECNERIGISEWRLDLMFKTPEIIDSVRKKFPYLKREQIQLVCVEYTPPAKK